MAMKDILIEDKKVLDVIAKKINEKWFNSELPSIVINTQPTEKAYGHFSPNRWEQGEEKFSEINISPVFFGKGPLGVIETLHHEMVHLYNFINGVKDVSGKRHNKKFYHACMERGLYSYIATPSIGFTTSNQREDQLPEWLEWYDGLVEELSLENYFTYIYVPTKRIKAKRINTSFTCVDTNMKFYLTDKLANDYYDGNLLLTSPYSQGGEVIPSDEL